MPKAVSMAFSAALIAEPVDERDGRQQRRRQERDQRDAAKQRLARHAAARERISRNEGRRHRDGMVTTALTHRLFHNEVSSAGVCA